MRRYPPPIDVPDHLDRWRRIVALPDDRLPLDEAALLISAAANPGLDVTGQLGRLDDLAGRVRATGAAGVCEVLFGELGLVGDTETYDDPQNSYLDRVLDRGRGIPISLSVLLIEVGRRCGVPLVGVGLPGHFVVRDPAEPEEVIDAFGGGRRLDRAATEALVRRAVGPDAAVGPELLAPVGPQAVLARMLVNLDASFERRGDLDALGWVSRMRAALQGAPAGDRAQLASRLAGLGRFDLAATTLEEVAAAIPDPRARRRMVREAIRLRARLN
ncbi:MAG TPA: transglutaminase-like domain-containing protein [Acidimicrobiales bacterium]|nr:transglutaminase-like domain-containing protein [Acidimicrobiales bacterium]